MPCGDLGPAAAAIEPVERVSQRQVRLRARPASRHASGHELATANLGTETFEAQRPWTVRHGRPGRANALRTRLFPKAVACFLGPARRAHPHPGVLGATRLATRPVTEPATAGRGRRHLWKSLQERKLLAHAPTLQRGCDRLGQ